MRVMGREATVMECRSQTVSRSVDTASATTAHASTSPATHTHTHARLTAGTTSESRYQKGKTNMDFTEARDSEWQWHQLGHMQVCTSLQTDNHASTPPLSSLQAGCPSCHPTNSVKAPKALSSTVPLSYIFFAGVSISCRRRWPPSTTPALTTLLG